MTAIEVKNLSKEFKKYKRGKGIKGILRTLFSRKAKIVYAVKNVNFDIKKGEIVGIIGPNGAGKSTVIKMLTGILTPTSGSVRVLGLAPYEKREENAKNIGVVFGQRTQLWWDLPVIDSFNLLKHIYEVPEKKFKRNMSRFTKILEIDKLFDTPVRKLSLGEKMRCDLAASLLHDPQVLFLDEPTIALDVVAKERMREFLKEVNKNRQVTIILTTHDMGDIEELCPRVIIIDKGKKIYDGPINEIRKKFTKERVIRVDFKGTPPKNMTKWSGVRLLKQEGDKFWLAVDITKVKVTNIIKRVLSKWAVDDIAIEEADIEEIIRRIYREGI